MRRRRSAEKFRGAQQYFTSQGPLILPCLVSLPSTFPSFPNQEPPEGSMRGDRFSAEHIASCLALLKKKINEVICTQECTKS
jgi:hypothetical protein